MAYLASRARFNMRTYVPYGKETAQGPAAERQLHICTALLLSSEHYCLAGPIDSCSKLNIIHVVMRLPCIFQT